MVKYTFKSNKKKKLTEAYHDQTRLAQVIASFCVEIVNNEHFKGAEILMQEFYDSFESLIQDEAIEPEFATKFANDAEKFLKKVQKLIPSYISKINKIK